MLNLSKLIPEVLTPLVRAKSAEWNADLDIFADFTRDDLLITARIGMGFDSCYKHTRILRTTLQSLTENALIELISLELDNLRSVDLARADDGGTVTREQLIALCDTLRPKLNDKLTTVFGDDHTIELDICIDFVDRLLRVRGWNNSREFGRGFVLRPKEQRALLNEFTSLIEVLLKELR